MYVRAAPFKVERDNWKNRVRPTHHGGVGVGGVELHVHHPVNGGLAVVVVALADL